MEFRILGPVEVYEHGRPIRLERGRQRALLALLLIHENETVSTERLIDELWGESPPTTVRTLLHGYVSKLRKRLGHDVVLTQPSGYLLRVEPGALDRDEFERLAAEGQDAAGAQDDERAAAAFRAALALWHGPALADFSFDGFAHGEIARLEELRLAALEERIEADLALGRHADVVAELEALVSAYPMRERPCAQLMLALYRSGRQADALAAYRAARRILVEELGIEPGAALQRLEREILRQDPLLDIVPVARASPAVPPTASVARIAGSAFVGRTREVGELVTYLEDALSGRGRLVLLAGEPGIGKSRLADELATRARERDAIVLVGRCWEAGGAPAFWPWVQALRSYVRDAEPDALRAQLGSGAADLGHLLPELREIFADLPEPHSLESEGARFRLFDSTASFLRNAATARPLVIALDDLHAADTPSLLLLKFLAGELAQRRILIVGCYRDVDPTLTDPLSSTLAELSRERVTRLLPLAGLGEPDVARFIELSTGVEPTETLVTTIHRETEGNPFFVGEVIRLRAAEGRLTEVGHGTTQRLTIPQGVRSVIGQRLGRLSQKCKHVLTLASVLGREFSLDALESVCEHSRETLLEVLDEATAERVVGEVPDAVGRLRFAHALVRDTLYGDLPATRRVRLHARVGEALESLYSENAEPHLAELAHHFFEAAPAGTLGEAIDYARRAGDSAVSLLAFEEAVRLYRMALQLSETRGAARCDLLLALGDAEARAGDTPASKRTYREAAELADALGLSERLGRGALGYGGRIIWAVSRDDDYLVPLLERALAALGNEDSTLRVRVLARLAGGPLRDARFPRETRTSLSQEALEMARRIGDPATLAYALDLYIPANESPENTRELLELSTELLEVAMEVGDRERAVEAHEHRFGRLLELGEMAGAQAELVAMAKLAEELRQPAQEWLVGVCRARLALLEGRLAEAEGLIDAALKLGGRAQSWNAAVTFGLQLYMLRREQGRLGEVEELIRRSVGEYPAYPLWRCVIAHMAAEMGHETESREAFTALATDDFAGVPFADLWLVSLSVLAETARSLGDTTRAAVLYELLLPYADRVADSDPEISTGSVARYLGILASMMERWEDGAAHFESALQINSRIGARPWVAHTQHDFARMLLDRGMPSDQEKAAAILASALRTCQKLGMVALEKKVSTILEGLAATTAASST